MSRTAAFSNLKLSNHQGSERIVTDTIQEAVDQLNNRHDSEEEEHTAILSAPAGYGWIRIVQVCVTTSDVQCPG